MKPLEQQTITDNFMFGAVFSDPEKCKALLECILDIKISRIEYVEREKTIELKGDAKGIRLDVYVEDDENTVYDIEIQKSHSRSLPKRVRYYQGVVDLNHLRRSDGYKKLKKSFIIFLCTFDAFGQGRYVYTFENTCNEMPELKLGDDSVKIILNTTGTVEDINNELKNTLQYMNGAEPKGELATLIEQGVQHIRTSEEWRLRYVTLLEQYNEKEELGKTKTLIHQIRDVKPEEISTAAHYLKVEPSFMELVLDLIAKHPDWDDKTIASEIIHEELWEE